MTTVVFSDDFTGSTATVLNRDPDVPLQAGVKWVNSDSSPLPDVDGGYLVVHSPTTTNTINVCKTGISGTDYGIVPPIDLTFVIKTPPNLGNIDNLNHGGVVIYVQCGGIQTSVRFYGYWNSYTSTMTWYIDINNEGSDVITELIGPSTEYTGVLRIQDGFQELSIFGFTWTVEHPFLNATGLNEVSVVIGGYSKLGSISVSTVTEVATLDFTIPKIQTEIYLGSEVNFTLPSIIGGVGVLSLDSTLPSIDTDITGHNSTGENDLSFSVPSLLFESNSGAQLSASLSPIALDFSMTGTALITVDVSLPTIDLDSGGLGSPYIVSADFELPRITSEADFGAYADIAFSSITVEASVTSGGVVSLDVTIPAVTLDCAGTATSYGSIVFTLPAIVPCAGITADFSIPSFSLDSYVSATITATYEAYAVNLNHADPNASDETTRYTNFPFTHVVRYKNSYYGVNTTGLYLLDGTTDAGAAIPFDVKTAMTDFKSPTKKTLASAYFSGRFGPASTITLTAGEDTPAAYSFSTPRDQAAQNHRQVFGKGLRERYYQLEVAGTGTLELDGIEMDVAKLSRRI